MRWLDCVCGYVDSSIFKYEFNYFIINRHQVQAHSDDFEIEIIKKKIENRSDCMLIVTVGYRCAIYFESLFCVSPRVFSVVKLTLLLLFSFNFIYSSALICSRGGTAAQQAQHWSLLYLKRYKCATEEEATNERTNKKKTDRIHATQMEMKVIEIWAECPTAIEDGRPYGVLQFLNQIAFIIDTFGIRDARARARQII